MREFQNYKFYTKEGLSEHKNSANHKKERQLYLTFKIFIQYCMVKNTKTKWEKKNPINSEEKYSQYKQPTG